MSRKPWWTTLTADNVCDLRRRVVKAIGKEFASALDVEVQDVVQQAFVALLRNRESIRAESDGLYRYLLVVARRAAFDRLKRARHRRAYQHPSGVTSEEPPSPAQEAEIREKHDAIRKVFCELDEFDRLILWSRVVEQRSIQAIANDLDLNWHRVADTVERVLAVIRRRLKD